MSSPGMGGWTRDDFNVSEAELKVDLSKLALAMMRALTLLCGLILVTAHTAHGQTETVLYSFTGGADGANVFSGVARDGKGSLYGTADSGGTFGFGTVFAVSPAGVQRVLYNFTGGADGGYPFVAGLLRGAKGTLYGTTSIGGSFGGGVVFQLTKAGTETVIYNFTGGADGSHPFGTLVRDGSGNLYGTTNQGGAFGFGTVFELSPTGNEVVLHSFNNTDGAFPYAGVVRDASGNLYGTTFNGGTHGIGTVFMLTATGTETVLYNFTGGGTGGGTDGSNPYAGLVRDSQGNLFGTTVAGGASGVGTVFRVTPTGTETVLHAFTGGLDGAYPEGGLIRDPKGNLLGTTYGGGSSALGTVFQLAKTGVVTALHNFSGGVDGANPYAGLVRDSTGTVYGTTYYGGASNAGTVLKVAP